MRTREETVAILKQFDCENPSSCLPEVPKASVLVPLFVKDGQLHTVMTLRSKELRTAGGEVCFPGGKKDPGDKDEVDTALREAQEEIGLPAHQVQVVSRLFPIVSKSGLLVTPVVGFIEESFSPRPNPAEVSAVFPVPLDFFTRGKDHRAASGMHSFHFVDPDSGQQYRIWGLTAAIAILVAVLASGKRTEFDSGFSPDDPFTLLQKNLRRKMSKL